jgi:hypothetical protein
MGLFSGGSRARKSIRTQRPTISHTAKWNTGWATFFINSDGVSWNQSHRDFGGLDQNFLEAAMAQLERAYHLNVSYPQAEKIIMDWMRGVQKIWKEHNPEHVDIPDGSVPWFDWSPPLPG